MYDICHQVFSFNHSPQHGYVITFIIKCEMKLLIYSHTSIVQSVKFGMDKLFPLTLTGRMITYPCYEMDPTPQCVNYFNLSLYFVCFDFLSVTPSVRYVRTTAVHVVFSW